MKSIQEICDEWNQNLSNHINFKENSLYFINACVALFEQGVRQVQFNVASSERCFDCTVLGFNVCNNVMIDVISRNYDKYFLEKKPRFVVVKKSVEPIFCDYISQCLDALGDFVGIVTIDTEKYIMDILGEVEVREMKPFAKQHKVEYHSL